MEQLASCYRRPHFESAKVSIFPKKVALINSSLSVSLSRSPDMFQGSGSAKHGRKAVNMEDSPCCL